ncbi:CDP-diacylglycerol--serine O-phosphatidyltransferase [Nocardia seriolae]|nr:CDP-diacylglycerol--serine O-phosphatidyltransferase [Nocardia seriolae]APA94377.1 CDP-diacylglycerol--serine O-phosphatidyltransferase [Nocardia seriolae]MTJ60411.1 CDP-diacylglycerol--serine O-phosphatidyltransferase [Nocardia seriolae]MTJ75467.1 CDP-diacylglycerol--serine O-phosphatidyltransferase [Nocardia seriolae]MTJ84698.1 CDP-diacylglycerol--serine O-phosphatidyltransferase [Nocardia seriolae]MTK38395.1 CDP-diacylglycerol--serine O-phosphatidyltransferase [Nocardia seriolae]
MEQLAPAPNQQRRRNRTVMLLPSMVTILGLCSGLSSVKFAMEGKLGIALALVGAAAVFDMLDGRIARMLDATTRMGAELDSLSDAIAFGVAPALVLYVTFLHADSIGWILALMFAVCMVLRLARFNTLMDDDNRPDWQREYFVGVPAPAGALIVLLPIALSEQFGDGWWVSFPLAAVWTVLTGLLCVSTLPTLAIKSVSVAPRTAPILLVLVALAAALLVTYPLILMMGLVALYLGHIPFAVHSARWVAARPETWNHKPAERRAQRRAQRRQRPLAGRVPRVSTARLRLRRPGPRERVPDRTNR